MILDLVKRFSPTPQEAEFLLNGSLLRVESNSQAALHRLQSESAATKADTQHDPIMNWRIVVEAQADASDCELIHHAFAYNGLSFVRIANDSFLAVDHKTGCGVSFITANFVEQDHLFNRYFLPAFISMIDKMEDTEENT